MSVDVSGFGWRMGSSDTILKGDHLTTIPSKFGPYWPRSFRGEDFLNIFPIGSYVKTKSIDVGCLGWPVGSSDTILKKEPPKDHSIKVWSQLAEQFQTRRFLMIFFFAEFSILNHGGHLDLRAGSSDTILKGEHPKTTPYHVWSKLA